MEVYQHLEKGGKEVLVLRNGDYIILILNWDRSTFWQSKIIRDMGYHYVHTGHTAGWHMMVISIKVTTGTDKFLEKLMNNDKFWE